MNRPYRFAAIATAILLAIAPPVLAQEATEKDALLQAGFGSQHPKVLAASKRGPHPALLERVTLDLDSATLAEACEFLAATLDGKVNFILHPGVREQIVTLSARDMKLGSILGLLPQLAPCQPLVEGPDGAWIPSLAAASGEVGEPLPIYIALSTAESAGETKTYIYAIGEILGKDRTVEDVAAAVEMAWGLQSPGTTSSLLFHEDTATLMVKGAPEMLAIADQVIAQMPGGVQVLQKALATRAGGDSDSRAASLAALPDLKMEQLRLSYEQDLKTLKSELTLQQQRYQEKAERLMRELDQALSEVERLKAMVAEAAAARKAEK